MRLYQTETEALKKVLRSVEVLGLGGLGTPGGILGAAYLRVSTEEQARDDRSGLDRQVVRIHDAAKQNGHFIPIDLIWAEDHTGTTMDRPALLALMAEANALRARGARAIYFEEMDRLGRAGPWAQGWTLLRLREAGLETVFAAHSADDITTFLYAWKAKEDNERRRLFLRHSNLKKAHAGQVTARRARFGYRLDRKTWKYEPDPERAAVVRQIWAWYGQDGLTLGEIVRQLHGAADGPPRVPSPSGKPWWPTRTVHLVLSERAYATGKLALNRWVSEHRRKISLRPTDEWISVSVPILVPPDVAVAVGQRLSEVASAKWRPRRAAAHEWLLQGVLRCGCGRAFSPKSYTRSKHGRVVRVALYECTGHFARPGRARKSLCRSAQISQRVLEDRVWAVVTALITMPEVVLAAPAQDEARRALTVELNRLFNDRKRLQAAWQKLWTAYREDVINKGTFDREGTVLRSHQDAVIRQIANVEQRLDALRIGDDLRGNVVDRLRQYQARISALDYLSRRRLIRQLFDEIVIDTVRGTLLFKGCVTGEVALRGTDTHPITFAVPIAARGA